MQALARVGWTPSHRWGQNFLVAAEVFADIATHVVRQPDEAVLEIGPGPGGLTVTLLEAGARVTAVDIDSRAAQLLRPLEHRWPDRFHLLIGDALHMAWDQMMAPLGSAPVTVTGNLPYYITSPFLGRLLEDFVGHWSRGIFMVQRDVAVRLVEPPGHRNSSVLGVLLRYQADVTWVLPEVSPNAFYPSPEIVSSVIQLERRDPLPVDWQAFRWVVRAGFQHRRKTLRQALARGPDSPGDANYWANQLTEIGIDPARRAESLTLEEWVRLASQWRRA
ncbi:MAG: 16S rRNA (adenine(1518)-N(6)/adenine(1519)-N(6))-dimethyltransferase RsmA [Sulfobacillus sp.]|nr:16S rRNA (adenine(1518)-N(6)/adenine(1519)-N(6))-dimethyltransferase RsmA [Sulfobacillus sp.]